MSSITKTQASPISSPQLSRVEKVIRCLKNIFSKSVKVDTLPVQLEVTSARLEEPRSAPPRRARVRPKRRIEVQSKSTDLLFDTFAPHALSPKLRYAFSRKEIDPEKIKNWDFYALSPKILPAFTK